MGFVDVVSVTEKFKSHPIYTFSMTNMDIINIQICVLFNVFSPCYFGKLSMTCFTSSGGWSSGVSN